MIVMCEECGKKYRIDPAVLGEGGARFRCRECGFSFTLAPETVAPQVSPVEFAAAPQSAPPPGEQAAAGNAVSAAKGWSTPPDIAYRSPGRRFGLTSKVVLAMLLVSLTPLFVFSAVSLKTTDTRIRAETELLAERTAEGLVNHVDEWIDKNIRSLNTLAATPAIQSMDGRQQEPLLKATAAAYPWMYLVFTLDTEGKNLARNDGKSLRDYSDRKYFRDVIAGNELAWQTLIGKTSGKPALVLAVPVRRDGKVVGVVANAMQIDQVSDRIATWRSGETGYAFLVDESGKVVAHPEERYVLQQVDLSQHPVVEAFRSGKTGPVLFRNDAGTACIGSVTGTRHGWALAVVEEQWEALAPLHHSYRFAGGLLAFTVVGVIWVAWFAGRTIVRPIRSLTEAADRISVGELDVELGVSSNDEIGMLAEAIGRMQDSIRLSIERLRKRR
jgi:methyl-accepting chemotaxis protein